jgi:acetylornithine deacetylase
MKGAGVTMWTVARALHDSGVDLDGDLELHSVVGGVCAESDIGTAAVLDAGHRTDATIALGATAPGGRQTLSTVAAGVLRVEIDITGKVTHCGNRPLAIRPGGRGDAVGVNALEKAMAVMAALGVLEDRWGITKSHAGFPPGSFTIGVDTFRSDAGFAFPAYFPDRATMALSVTYPPSDDPSAVVEEIGEHLRASCADDPWLAEHPPTIRSTDILPPMALAREHPLVIALTSGLQAVGGDRVDTSDPGPVPSLVGPTDGALYARYGTPTLVFGPGDPSSARHIDESVAIDDVIVAAKALLRTAVAWCGRGT